MSDSMHTSKATEQDPTIVRQEIQNESWLHRHKLQLSLGGLAVSTAATFALNPFSEIKHQVLDAAPAVGLGFVASELMWTSGLAMMTISTGEKIKNIFTLRSRFNEITQNVGESRLFKSGLAINTVGAIGSAATLTAGVVTKLPVESWGVLGVAALDVASTVAIRKGIYDSTVAKSKEKKHERPLVREAREDDIPRLAELDLKLFRKAYGEDMPAKEDVEAMFLKRFKNAPGWMFVTEVDGSVEGFVTAFRTNKSHKDFVSWEDSTNNGTLDGVVERDGKYVYVVNMTIDPKAMKAGAEPMLLANLFAKGIKNQVEYGYFVSRMPLFARWVEREKKRSGEMQQNFNERSVLDALAKRYVELKKPNSSERFDPELRLYESSGFIIERVVANGFQDEASLDYGVVCRADVPPNGILKKSKMACSSLSLVVRTLAKYPTLIEKVL